jgi:nucleoside 2-deoxyribosyltransferase
MKVYLAGPDVFLPDAVDIGRAKVGICAAYGLTGLFPLDNQVDRDRADASLQIFRGNEAMMNAADTIIANLTPFRGPGADPGTVYELGYMAARGKLCLGYSNDPRFYAERVADMTELKSGNGLLTDPDGLAVENFDLADNLMMIHALNLYGYPLVTPAEAPADLMRDLACFESCVRLAAGRIAAAAV